MSKRTKIKLRNANFFLKRYIFNGKYIIRNLIAATILTSIIAICFVLINLLPDNKEVAAVDNIDKVVLTSAKVTSIDNNSITILKDNITKVEANKVANETTALANYDSSLFDNRFLVTTDMLNIRNNPNEEGEVVGVLYEGYSGTIISKESDWTKVQSGSITGYVKSEYIINCIDDLELAKQYLKETATVIDTEVNIRSDASVDAKVVAFANQGEVYSVLTTTSDKKWVQVEIIGDDSGFISAEFVNIQMSFNEATIVNEEYQEDTDEEDTDEEDIDEEDADEEELGQDGQSVSSSEDESQDNSDDEDTSTEDSGNDSDSDDSASNDLPDEKGNSVVVPTTTRSGITLTDEDIFYLACIVSAEAGSDTYEGQLAVANVCINRLESGYWGSTIKEVIYATGQFTPAYSGSLDKFINSGPYSLSQQAANDAASGINNVGTYTSFRPLYNASYASYSSYSIIGAHCFF